MPVSHRKFFQKYIQEKKEAKTHAVLSASGSERWLKCPGSIRASRGATVVDNEWSITGTHAHTLLQFILENPTWRRLLDLPEAKAFKKHIEFSEEQLHAVLVAVDYVRSEMARLERSSGRKPILHIEKKVELRGVGFGTADIILYQPFGTLHVMDYKNGRSAVKPEENTQGLYYAHAVADLYGWDFHDLWITIIQPNATHKDGPIRTWKTTMDRLEKAGRQFRLGAKRTKDKDAPLVAHSSYCWFCPARPTCPAQLELQGKKAQVRFGKRICEDLDKRYLWRNDE